MSDPEVSIVIPVYNEEEVLPQLFARLYPALDALGRTYEIIFVNDGSRDRSAGMLRAQYDQRRDVTRVVLFNGNYGQHMAIMAGFEHCRGRRIVTLDADLQNPPEEIGSLLGAMDKGHDYVGTIRRMRQDSVLRRTASRMVNALRERTTRIKMTDQGCMMRAYDRFIVDAVTQSREMSTFIPALAYTYAVNPTEIEIGHEARAAGESKYSWMSLARLNFDLMTGFSIAPLRVFSLVGFLISIVSALLVVYLVWRRLVLGPEVEGVFTLFAIVFLLIGVVLFGVGLLGEYIGRIYMQVRQRPRFIIQAVLQDGDAPASRRVADEVADADIVRR
jgi:undecaprenyl-phosphate 4-deoxy-4-formamido-L-arabinose transferase